jgi:hypothetical protein
MLALSHKSSHCRHTDGHDGACPFFETEDMTSLHQNMLCSTSAYSILARGKRTTSYIMQFMRGNLTGIRIDHPGSKVTSVTLYLTYNEQVESTTNDEACGS